MSEVQTTSQGAARASGAMHMWSVNAASQRGAAIIASLAALTFFRRTTLPSHRPLRLNTGELVNIRDGEGLEVVCLEGAVWITQLNDPRDIVIGATESFVLDKPGLALVCASAGPATVAIEVPQRRTVPMLPAYRWSMRSAARTLQPVSAGL